MPCGVKRWGVVLLTLGTFVLQSSVVCAQDPAAEALFRSAQDAAQQGDWHTACDRFEESNRLEPAPGTVMNIARCREELGEVASAWKSYMEAAQKLPEGDRRVPFARGKASELSRRVPRLVLSPPEERGVVYSVTVGGVTLEQASYGVPLPFNPGALKIIVRADGREDNVAEVKLMEGERLEYRLALGPVLSGGDAAGGIGESPSRSSPLRTVSLIGGSLGLGAAIFGGVWMGIEAAHVKDHCEAEQCDPDGMDAASRGRTAVFLTSAGAAVAVVGFGLAGYLTLKKDESSKIQLAPLYGGGMLMLRQDL